MTNHLDALTNHYGSKTEFYHEPLKPELEVRPDARAESMTSWYCLALRSVDALLRLHNTGIFYITIQKLYGHSMLADTVLKAQKYSTAAGGNNKQHLPCPFLLRLENTLVLGRNIQTM